MKFVDNYFIENKTKEQAHILPSHRVGKARPSFPKTDPCSNIPLFYTFWGKYSKKLGNMLV